MFEAIQEHNSLFLYNKSEDSPLGWFWWHEKRLMWAAYNTQTRKRYLETDFQVAVERIVGKGNLERVWLK